MNLDVAISIVYLAGDESVIDGPAVRMLQTAIEAVNKYTGGNPLVFAKASFDDVDETLACIGDSQENVIFLVNLAHPLCSRDERQRIVRGPSYKAVARILEVVRDPPIFLVLPPGIAISGIDLVACLSAGVAGIIEERALIMDDVIQKVANFSSGTDNNRRALLIGSAKDRIEQAHATVLEWSEDLESTDRLDWWSWRAAVALAQIEKLEPILGFGQLNSYKTLAAALNVAGHITSFALNVDDLQRVLSTLSRRWLGENHESRDRFRLPEFARQHGFPRLPVHVTCGNGGDIDKRIYETLKMMNIRCADQLGGMQCCEVEI